LCDADSKMDCLKNNSVTVNGHVLVETHVRSLARPLSVCRSQTLDDKRRYRHHWKHVRSESSPLSYEDIIARDKHNHAVITLACRAVHATDARDDDGAPASSRGNRDQKCIALFFVIQVEYEELLPGLFD